MTPAVIPAAPRRIAGLVLLLGLLLGCTAPSDPSPPAALAPTTPAAPTPSTATPAPPCTVRTSDGSIPLTRSGARSLTDLATRAQREEWSSTRATESYQRVLTADGAATGPAPTGGPALARALSGRSGPALTCVVTRRNTPAQEEGPTGLTATAEQLRQRVLGSFGPLPMGGFAAGGVSTGHVDDSSHYDGRAMDIFFRPVSATNTARGWVLAHWLVAHGEENTLLSVIFSDRIWTSWASCAGWRPYEHPGGPTTDPVLRHLDHVHTAVQGPRRQFLSPEERRERARRLPPCVTQG